MQPRQDVAVTAEPLPEAPGETAAITVAGTTTAADAVASEDDALTYKPASVAPTFTIQYSSDHEEEPEEADVAEALNAIVHSKRGLTEEKALDAGYEVKVVVPEGISVSTREAYGGIIPREKMGKDAPAPLREALRKPVRQWKDFLVNDFESSVFKAHPELEAIKRSLYDSGAVYAAMSGSGSALFGMYPIQR